MGRGGLGQEVACWFQCWKNSGLISLIRLVLYWCYTATLVFLRKNNLLRCWGWLSLLNWIGALILSLLLKMPSRKLEHWFMLAEVVLYLYKSTIRSCMEDYCHIWVGTPSCYLEMLDMLQKRIYRTVGPSPAASLELFVSWTLFSLYSNRSFE